MVEGSDCLYDVNAMLDAKYGKEGTPSRIKFNEEAFSVLYGEVINEERKKALMSKKRLARRLGKDAAYIDRVEKGLEKLDEETVDRIMKAMGRKIKYVKLEPCEDDAEVSKEHKHRSIFSFAEKRKTAAPVKY